ncbi:hypothetical protein ANN_03783 [Periplaneta americana]|uniref:Uncharacterized protein n=1 Tax=Periplaneta americana TaxID=6978 RepID=A0ABQ8U5X9_PERAM|nr:hypothetical protein ANN_03783 [Periplaneta americana]
MDEEMIWLDEPVDEGTILQQKRLTSVHVVCCVFAVLTCKQTTTTVDATIHIKWPARSPDMSPLDFFLWGTVKDGVYQNILTTPDDMQQRIRQACVSIQPATCRAVLRSFGERLRMCINVNGHYLEHLLQQSSERLLRTRHRKMAPVAEGTGTSQIADLDFTALLPTAFTCFVIEQQMTASCHPNGKHLLAPFRDHLIKSQSPSRMWYPRGYVQFGSPSKFSRAPSVEQRNPE